MKARRVLFILHYSPPIHGASKVGDTIKGSKLIKAAFRTKFIKIKSSNNLEEIGSFSFKKIWHAISLFFKVILHLFFFRPSIIYFTASPSGFAFYRDLFVSIPIKIFLKFNKKCSLFYHYHANGIFEFTKGSIINLKLSNFFLKNSKVIFISERMKRELELVKGFKKIVILNNGVRNNLSEKEFEGIIKKREKSSEINVLYLSNMMKDKGYDKVLELAHSHIKSGGDKVKFHFAGAWATAADKAFFNSFINENSLEKTVIYHGLVSGRDKLKLFSISNMFLLPTSYSKEIFPLSVLEALSYGLPILAFNKGAIYEIINDSNGIITDENSILKDFNTLKRNYLNAKSYNSCRKSFLNNYTNEIFESNLIAILKDE